MNESEAIESAAALVFAANRIVALTGAGFSRPSGIPDFRSESGIWQHHDPFEIASLRAFVNNPQRFYTWFRPLAETINLAQPNPAHRALAALEADGKLRAVVTQNIDGLHQRAGSRTVFELHGHLRSAHCLHCEREVPIHALADDLRRGKVPLCICGGIFKPDVVLFDEGLPRGLFWLSQREIEQCDLLIIAGTSLEVAPVCDLPAYARRHGAKLLMINLDPTHIDDAADVRIAADVAMVLPAIVAQAGVAMR